MKSAQDNKFFRFFLWVIDGVVGLYLYRGFSRSGEPYRKATEREKRFGGFMMAMIPSLALLAILYPQNLGRAIDPLIRSHSGLWLYLAVVGLGVFWFFVIVPLIPKISLRVTVTIAIFMWPIMAWFAWKQWKHFI